MILPIVLVVFAVILFSVTFYFTMIYNGLVRLKHEVERAWANIDVIFKQRHDELPKLIAAAEGYMEYEQTTLKKIMEARNMYVGANSVDQKADASNTLSGAVKQLFALSEQYPDLKANQSFMQLQNRLTSLEDSLSDRREFYNSSVNNYNIRLEQFPDKWVADLLQYQPKPMFEVDEDEKTDLNIQFKIAK